MKVVQHKSTSRTVLIGMVTDKSVLGAISERWTEDGLYASRWENLIAGWCIRYYRKYHKAPCRAIGGYYDRWAERNNDEETAALVEKFLAGLSKEYERNGDKLASDYILDVAAELFNDVKAKQLADQVQAQVEAGYGVKAQRLLAEYRKIEMGNGSWVSPLKERSVFEKALDEANLEEIVVFEGALGNFFKKALVRDAFVAFMGKEKVGKSYDIWEIAHQAIRQEQRTGFFEVGDMSQGQVVGRLASRIAKIPLYGDPNPIKIPIKMDSGNPPDITFKEETYPNNMRIQDCWPILEKFSTKFGNDYLRLSCHPNSSISVRGIEEIIEGWIRDGWVPDVIVIDYADILAPMDGKAETRDQINANWKAMRALSQKFHCLVVTATQTDADSYDAQLLSRSNFSEDKRKYAHVTGMVGINQTPTEKEAQLFRLNWILRRNLDFSERACVWVCHALSIANPWIFSCF